MLNEPTIDPIPLHPSLPTLRACLARAALPSAIRGAFRNLLDADQDETDPHEAALLDRLDWTDLDLVLLLHEDNNNHAVEKSTIVPNDAMAASKTGEAVSLAMAEGLRLSRAIRQAGSGFLRRGEVEDWLLASDFEEAVERLGNCAGDSSFTPEGDAAAALVHQHLVPQLADLRAIANQSEKVLASNDGTGSDVHASEVALARRSRASTRSQRDGFAPASTSIRLQILSDLHLDVWDYDPVVAPNIDTIVVAGDVREDAVRAVRWLDEAYGAAGVPIVYVLGNHEPYGYVHGAMLDAARAAAAGTCVHLIENDETVLTIGGVPSVPGMRGDGGVRLRVLGATLWTDLAVDGPKARERALRFGGRMVNDYVYIRTRTDAEDDRTGGQAGGDARGGGTRGDNAPDDAAPGRDASASTSDNAPVRRLVPADMLRWHETSRAWLTGQLAERLQETHHGPTLVVTHHAPHPNSLDRAFDGDGTHAFFASDLSAMIEERGPDVWVHGHVHQHRDYRIGRTRIVCNPRGYPGEKSGFDPGLVIEIPADGSESEANEGGTPVDDGGSGPGEPPLAQGTKEHRS